MIYEMVSTEIHYFDLENPRDLARLQEPMLSLEALTGLIIIDEIQRVPDLFTVLRVLVDVKKDRKFLILGSASRDLIKQASETLAGRIRYIELNPFSYPEVEHIKDLWLRGGFPDSYLAESLSISNEWRKAYVATFLERDIPNLGISIPPQTLRRFRMMLAHYHGSICNTSDIGKSLGASHTTIRSYLDILKGTFMIRQLQPWWENINKRQVKSAKIYFRDTGIYHTLTGIADQQALLLSPKLGASWVGMVLEELIRYHNATPEECYFWAIHAQAELDLLIIKDGKRLGFEIKYTDAPTITKSMHTAMKYLNLDSLTVITPSELEYPMDDKIQAVGLEIYLSVGCARCERTET